MEEVDNGVVEETQVPTNDVSMENTEISNQVQTEEPSQPSSGVTADDFRKFSKILSKEEPVKADNPVEENKDNSEAAPKADETENAVTEQGNKEDNPTVWDLEGEQVTPEQVLEWKKGFMMQSDYTQKTQALAEERRKFENSFRQYGISPEDVENAFQVWQALSEDPIGALENMRESFEEQGITEAKDPEILEVERQLAKERAEKEHLATEKAVNEQKALLQQFDQFMTGLETKYKDQGFNRDEVIQYAIDNRINNPELAFKAMKHDAIVADLQAKLQEKNQNQETLKKQGVQEYLQSKVQNHSTPLPLGANGSGGSSGSGFVEINKPKTLREASKAALARLNGLETG